MVFSPSSKSVQKTFPLLVDFARENSLLGHLTRIPPAGVGRSAAMHWAALHGRTKTVEAILHYLNPDQLLHVFSLCDKDGQTALQLAGNNDHLKVMYMFHKRAMQHVSKEMKSRILLFTFA